MLYVDCIANALFRVITNDTAEVAVQFAKSIKALR